MDTRPASHDAVAALVAAGLLDQAAADEAERVVEGCLAARTPAEAGVPLRRRLAEVAGYVGGAFVVGAAVLFFANTWTDLALAAQVGILWVIAVLLVVAGGALTASAGGRTALREPAEDVRRRLVSVLMTGAALAAAGGTGVWLDEALADEELVVLLAALVGLLVASAGYVLAASTVGQGAMAFAAFMMIPAGLAVFYEDFGPTAIGVLVLALGVIWLVVAEGGLWRELLPARVIGLVLALVGAQIPLGGDRLWVGYGLTALVGAVAFAAYLARRAWPYLAAGVVGVTIAVPEAVDDIAGESLGAAGVLLATGLALLAAALLGLRLRQEVQEQQ